MLMTATMFSRSTKVLTEKGMLHIVHSWHRYFRSTFAVKYEEQIVALILSRCLEHHYKQVFMTSIWTQLFSKNWIWTQLFSKNHETNACLTDDASNSMQHWFIGDKRLIYLRLQNKGSSRTPKRPLRLWGVKEWYAPTPVLFVPFWNFCLRALPAVAILEWKTERGGTARTRKYVGEANINVSPAWWFSVVMKTDLLWLTLSNPT